MIERDHYKKKEADGGKRQSIFRHLAIIFEHYNSSSFSRYFRVRTS